ncbi:YidC/Oxa1 family membrane protein insertase [Kribbella deserti]|uniref:Membrane protein insertase YidC n=1 Tax=Kribbella deserti TaxID=1926257 RepID=A0ABV6QM60_9ACTN
MAIVLCTLAVRLVLLPLGIAAIRGAKARTELMPKISEITKKHRGNPDRAQREIAELQAETGTSLFAGCLPLLAQLCSPSSPSFPLPRASTS